MGILPSSQNAYTTSFPGHMSLHLFTCLEHLPQGKRVVDHLNHEYLKPTTLNEVMRFWGTLVLTLTRTDLIMEENVCVESAARKVEPLYQVLVIDVS